MHPIEEGTPMEIFNYFNIDRAKYLDRIKKLFEAYDEHHAKIQLTRGHRHLSREFDYAKEMIVKIEEALKEISIECFGKIDKYGLPIVDIPEEDCRYFYTLSNTNGKRKEVTKEFYYKELIPREAHNYLFHGGDNHNPHKVEVITTEEVLKHSKVKTYEDKIKKLKRL